MKCHYIPLGSGYYYYIMVWHFGGNVADFSVLSGLHRLVTSPYIRFSNDIYLNPWCVRYHADRGRPYCVIFIQSNLGFSEEEGNSNFHSCSLKTCDQNRFGPEKWTSHNEHQRQVSCATICPWVIFGDMRIQLYTNPDLRKSIKNRGRHRFQRNTLNWSSQDTSYRASGVACLMTPE